MSTKPLLDKKDSLVKYCVSDDDVHVETVEKNSPEEEYNDEDVSSESYPASSHYTENTDSVTGGFGLTNRVSYVLCTKDICPTSVTRVKCGVCSTLCWKIGNISGSTELFGL